MSWKLSRTVLRGGTNGNIGPLLGKRDGKTKQPYCFEINEGELFAFAGIWDRWKDASAPPSPITRQLPCFCSATPTEVGYDQRRPYGQPAPPFRGRDTCPCPLPAGCRTRRGNRTPMKY